MVAGGDDADDARALVEALVEGAVAAYCPRDDLDAFLDDRLPHLCAVALRAVVGGDDPADEFRRRRAMRLVPAVAAEARRRLRDARPGA